jgi:hypothetical protein
MQAISKSKSKMKKRYLINEIILIIYNILFEEKSNKNVSKDSNYIILTFLNLLKNEVNKCYVCLEITIKREVFHYISKPEV